MAEFDVLLSFAAPERHYAQAIWEIATANGLRVFFDEEYQHEIWGQNLVEYLDRTYRERGAYVLILVSAAYKDRAYTRVERRAAFDRMIESAGEYVLPVRVDDTWLDGIPKTTAYLDLRTQGVIGVCELLVRKIARSSTRELVIPQSRADLQRQERLAAALHSPHPLDRLYAVKAFGEQPADASGSVPPGVLSVLSKALGDADPMVSREAAGALGRLGPAAGTEAAALIGALRNSHPLVREAAAGALGTLGAPGAKAVPDLMDALRDDDVGVRVTAADTLGRLGAVAAEAVPALVAACSDDRLRSRAAAAIEAIGAPPRGALSELVPALASSVPEVRRAAVDAIGAIAEPSDQSIAALISALTDGDEDVRKKAEAALAGAGPPAHAPLVRALQAGEPDTRVAAATVLGRMGPPSEHVISALAAVLGDAGIELRKEAAIALGKIGPSAVAALPALRLLLDDAVQLSRRQAPGRWGYEWNYAIAQAFDLVAAACDALGSVGPAADVKPMLTAVVEYIKGALALCPPNEWRQEIGPPYQYMAAQKAGEAARRALTRPDRAGS